MRKLVTIKRVRQLMPIPEADRIELALIDDWACIVKKGEFAEGDFCTYFEIDSLLPEEPRYEFLSSSKREYRGVTKYRIKTMKMRGVISQGLALPLKTFPEITKFADGDDVTELLKVLKYDAEEATDNTKGPKAGNAGGRFPSFIPKTDQERIQNLPHYYGLYKDHEWEETLKLDGSSLSVFKVTGRLNLWQRIKKAIGIPQEDYHFGVCSRNLELKRTDNFTRTFLNNGKSSEYSQSDFWKIVIQDEIEKYLPLGFALQGELIGPKIQANHEKVQENQFYVFDIYDINAGRYLLPAERYEFFEDYFKFVKCDIKHVPIIRTKTRIFTECEALGELQERVTGESINKGTVSEGRVYKSCTTPGLSFKCISNAYLLKEG